MSFEQYSRRDFLKFLGVMGGSAISASLVSSCRPWLSSGAPSYTVAPWSGDDFTSMHRIRDWARRGNMPAIPTPSETVDRLIIGGGLSGLTLAYYLRHENFVLLERESELGGNAKSAEFQGVPYAKGSAYLVDLGEPYGELYEALNLDLKPVKAPDNLFPNPDRLNHHWLPFGDVQAPDALQSGFDKLKNHLAAFLMKPQFPGVPIQQATPEQLRYDNGSFYDYLKDDYPPLLLEYVDAYCRSALGGGIQQISAYAGINFYSEIAGDIVAFPGGNAVIAKALVNAVNQEGSAGRFRTGTSVFQIEDKGDAVWVTYFDNKNPEQFKTIAAKQVVVATPYLIASRMLKGLDTSVMDTLRSCRYDSYLVANLCFNTALPLMGYDHWVPVTKTKNNSHQFTDFIIADWVNEKHSQAGDKKPFVLTLYAPFANPTMGRQRMLMETPDKLSAEMAAALSKVVSYKPDQLSEVRLTRYGHQLLCSETGLIRRLSKMPRQFGRIHLCHSDGQGMASIESAIMEAHLLKSRLR